jgi:hypothetical protein
VAKVITLKLFLQENGRSKEYKASDNEFKHEHDFVHLAQWFRARNADGCDATDFTILLLVFSLEPFCAYHYI